MEKRDELWDAAACHHMARMPAVEFLECAEDGNGVLTFDERRGF